MKFKKPASSIKRTYIDPFLNFRRNLVFLGTFLGMFGFGLVNTVSSYDLAGQSYISFFSFAAAAYLTSGFIYWPLLYLGFSATDGIGWRLFLFCVQVSSLGLYVQTPADPLYQGLVSGIMMAPFWTTHHIAMVQNTTKENRGYEVTVGMLITMGSSLLSALISGYSLDKEQSATAIFVSLLSMMAGTLCFLFATKIVRQHSPKRFVSECKRVMNDNPYMIRRIISHSLFDLPALATAGIMKLAGISPLAMTGILIARLVIMAILSPAIGTVSHTYRRHAYGLGIALVAFSWLLLATGPESILVFTAFIIVFNIGTRIKDASLMTGLYEMQSYASMMWSEVYMAVGRMLTLFLLMPLLFWNITAYLISLSVLAGLIFIYNKKWQRMWANAQAM